MYDTTQQNRLLELTRKLLRTDTLPETAHTADELREVINYHDWRYYVLSEPVITDYEYDKLFSFLKQLEGKHPEWQTPDSPTQRVARGLTEEFTPVPHLVSMLSLENSYNEADLYDFDRRVKEFIRHETPEYCIEPKFDGSSIALIYENDRLVRAATRGDGIMGDDITNNAMALSSIPLRAAFSKYGIYRVEIRGEVIIQRHIFEKMNEERRARGEKVYQNARNTASGSLRTKDPNETRARHLEAIMYHISYAEDPQGNDLLASRLTTHYQCVQILHDCGFKTPLRELRVCRSVSELQDVIHEWNERRHTFPIDTDGMVIKVNSLRHQQVCGSTAHHPRWAIAYKFAARQAHSKLLKVEFQVGRTGAITPVAKIEPVFLSGVTISSISLHNEDFIREKDIKINDTVIVERAGEVIPYIVGVVEALRDGSQVEIEFPRNCPSCNSALVKPAGEAVWRCDNADCPAQTEERLIHFVSKDAMDIEGCGKETIASFIQLGLLKSIEDLYRLPYEHIRKLEGWKDKSVSNLKNGIEESKKRPLWRLLHALGIRHVGVTTSKDVAAHIQSIFDLERMSIEQLMAIEGIGPKVAQSIYDFFHQPANIRLLHELKKLGVNTENKPEHTAAKNNKLQGKTFLFTGTLKNFTRARAKQLVEENGGRLLSSVSANLNYLVVGEDAGSKLAKAQKIPSIQIISEEEFLQMIS
ncbi:MAG: NAD-dependent DNA ligase LigA [Chitinophagales bacterium]|nr:NAD-dependent DNA ligase LigA [Chitinophagales bacterium]MDW8418279.1 NAD-dependent DNA ligase LigA [Chitinophagales bacterium]